jgi:hypothetical protein
MKAFVFLALLTAGLTAALVSSGHAQTSGPGTIMVSADLTCPTIGNGPPQNQFPTNSHCYSGTISCSNVHSDVPDIAFTFGVQGIGGTAGTIAFFSHGDGTTLDFDNTVIGNYNSAHFQTVEVVWQSDTGASSPWELASMIPAVIKHAACRPATLLNWIFSHIYGNGGKCAEGVSAGSAAIAYSMAQYNINYLDAVEFLSGPPLSDISKGCGQQTYQSANVCSESFCKSAPPGMTPEGSWLDTFKYTDAESAIDRWTNLPETTCGTFPNSYASNYLDMSIVDQELDSTFHYPATSVSVWVCAKAGVSNSICGGSNPNPNNSAAEADYFADQIAGFGSARALNLYRVDKCANSEDVGDGVVPAFYNNSTGCPTGNTVIASDMAKQCKAPPTHD